MHQLIQHLNSFQVTSIDPSINGAAKHGANLGEKVWNVLNNNIYWSDEDKTYMANLTAKMASEHYNEAINMQKDAEKRAKDIGGDVYDGYDMLFHPKFRKGLTGINEEKRMRALMDFVAPDDYNQGDTDWDTEAVVDEDQL